ncbi:hypothetical protein [Streptomyces sp. NPDC059009]|uniref:hypothetical protein n=1 Tax=Streptomyces sp. NPDC059009 TaxID=3346694 RepID=UPI003686400D
MGVGVLALVAGCGSNGDGAPGTAGGSLEQLAVRARCAPDITTDAADLRQATCKKGSRRFVLATFTTDRGQSEWFAEARAYGGTYLVGRKWIVVGSRTVVTEVRERLGGTVVAAGHEHGDGGHHGAP